MLQLCKSLGCQGWGSSLCDVLSNHIYFFFHIWRHKCLKLLQMAKRKFCHQKETWKCCSVTDRYLSLMFEYLKQFKIQISLWQQVVPTQTHLLSLIRGAVFSSLISFAVFSFNISSLKLASADPKWLVLLKKANSRGAVWKYFSLEPDERGKTADISMVICKKQPNANKRCWHDKYTPDELTSINCCWYVCCPR